MKSTYTALILSLLIFSCTNNPRNSSMANIIDAPKAKQMTKELSVHDDVRQDSFYWLNEREKERRERDSRESRALPPETPDPATPRREQMTLGTCQ